MGFVCVVGFLAVMLPHLVADFLIEVTKKYLLVLVAKLLPRLLWGCCRAGSVCANFSCLPDPQKVKSFAVLALWWVLHFFVLPLGSS